MTYLRAKVQGQRSVGSDDRVEINGHTEGRRRLHYRTFLANDVSKHICNLCEAELICHYVQHIANVPLEYLCMMIVGKIFIHSFHILQ